MYSKVIFPFSILFLLLLSCNQKDASITPEIRDITESVYASGFVKSKDQYEVFSKYNGVIEKILVEEGTHVKKGQALFQLDNADSKIMTENARISSIASDFKVNADKLEELENNIVLARKKLANDSSMYVRQKKLWANKIGSQVDLEQRELNYQNSKLALKNAKIRYDDVKRQLQLASNQSKNNLQIAELQEDDYVIRSEVDGVVYKIDKEVGELVNGQQPIAVIGSDEFIVELTVDELDVVKIKKGQQVIIRMDSYGSEVFEAHITSVDPMMDERTRSFNAEAVFDKKPTVLYPNLTAEANIVVQTKQDVLTIPRNYLVNDTTVLLESGDVRKVETGLMDYSLVEIKNGIDENTRIVLPEQ